MTARSLILAAAFLVLPLTASAQSRTPNFWGGAGLGFETGNGFSGVQLRLDGEVPVQRLTPQIDLSGVGTFTYVSLNHGVALWKLTVAPRATVRVTPVVDVYGDVGLGFYHAWWTGSHSKTGLTLKPGVGATYAINPRLKLWGDASFHGYFNGMGGDSSFWTFGLLAGVKYGF